MSFLTVIDGGSKRPKPFAMNAHGVAKFMIAGAHAARKVIESYAFPNEEKAKIIVPVPAKGIIFEFFKLRTDCFEVFSDQQCREPS